MQTIRIQTTQNVSIQYNLASVGDRILAYIIDHLILFAYLWGIISLFFSYNIDNMWAWFFGALFPWLFYPLISELTMDGQTLGKRVFRIKVVRLDGSPASTGDYLLRWLLSLVEYNIGAGAIALVVVASSSKGQRLGDLAAGTTVIKLDSAPTRISSRFLIPEEEYQPLFPQASSLSDRDFQIIQQTLDVYRKQGNTEPASRLADKLKMSLNITTDLDAVSFLTAIVKDHNHLTSRPA